MGSVPGQDSEITHNVLQGQKIKKLLKKKYETEKLGLSVHWRQINLGGRGLGEIERDSFIVCQAKEIYWGSALKNHVSQRQRT